MYFVSDKDMAESSASYHSVEYAVGLNGLELSCVAQFVELSFPSGTGKDDLMSVHNHATFVSLCAAALTDPNHGDTEASIILLLVLTYIVPSHNSFIKNCRCGLSYIN